MRDAWGRIQQKKGTEEKNISPPAYLALDPGDSKTLAGDVNIA
jgi:hypothetical protein